MKLQKRIHIAGWIGALLLMLVSQNLLAAEISVRADRNPVGLNETFHLVYEASGDLDGKPDFSVLEPLVDVLGQSQGTNISIINGRYNKKATWTLTVLPKRKGELLLPPVPFGKDRSNSLRIKVTDAPAASRGDQVFFSRLEAEPKSAYVQQQIIVHQRLYSAKRISAYGFDDLKIEGGDAVVEPLGEEKQYRQTIGGQDYIVIDRAYAVFAQQPGTLRIQPALAEARAGGSRSGFMLDPFSDPFSDPFGRRGETFRTRSNGLSLEIRPVPAGVDVNPWLPASKLELQAVWPEDPPRMVQGEPVTLTLSLKAEGLTAAQLPDLQLPAIDGVKQYPDQPLLNDVKNDNGITGYRLQKIALIPTRAGEIRIPAIELAWWNVETNRREVARVPARTLQVIAAANPAPAAPPATGTRSPAAAPAPTDNGDDKPSAEVPLNTGTTRVDAGYWPWISLILAAGWGLTLVLWWWSRRGTARPERPAAASPSRRIERAEKELKALRKACAARNDEACRRHLLAWGQALFGEDFHLAGDALDRLPRELADLTRQLDARLYASSTADLDHARIAEQAQEVTRQQAARAKSGGNREGLAPLDPTPASA